MGSFSSSFHCEHECNSGIVRLRESSSKVHANRVLRKFRPSKQTCLWIIKALSLLQKHTMVSFYTREDPTSIMNKKTDDMECQSDDGISNVPKTVLVGISHECHPDNDSHLMTLEEAMHERGVSTDIEGDVQTTIYQSFAVSQRMDRCRHSKQFINTVWLISLTQDDTTASGGVFDGLICTSGTSC